MSSNIQIYSSIHANVVMMSALDKHMCLVKKFTFIQCIVKINVNLKGVKKPNRKGNKSGSLDQAIKPNVRTIFPIKNKKTT